MSWPSYAEILAPGIGLGQDEDVERTPFDDGMIRQEKRYAAAMGAVDVSALIDAVNLSDFRQWAKGNAHAWFDVDLPHLAATAQARVRDGAGGIRYRLHQERRGKALWRADLTLEGPGL